MSQVVDAIVRYLDPPAKEPLSSPGQSGPGMNGPSRYYSDGDAEPGMWMGNGAAESGLEGVVNPRDFARVLAGRNPHTGVRLITAQGSAGRRPTLARGTLTRWHSDGEPLYDVADAAAALKLEVAEVERMVIAGVGFAVGHLFASSRLAGRSFLPEFEGGFLLATIDADGTSWIAERELQRCEAGRSAGPDPEAVAAAGWPGDAMGVPEAARVAGLSSQYMRSLCQKWERNQERIEHAAAFGKEPPRPFLRACRGIKGQWVVKRSDLVDFLRHRKPPAVRVGYDLTLTTEKSLGVLALLGDDHTRSVVLGAIEAGNRRGLAHLEHTAAMARAKGEEVSTRGWTVASFRHLTSRALDPFPHHHNVVANTVVDPEGTRRALDARWLYRHAGEASSLATAEMRYRLTTDLGVQWRRGRKGGWEIDGIPDSVLRAFSRRSNEVDEAVAELEALIGRTATIEELRGVITRTRPSKKRMDAGDLVAEWWERASAIGFKPRDLARCVSALEGLSTPPEPESIFERLAAPDGLCSGASVFTRADVIAAVIEMAVPDEAGQDRPMLVAADSVERLADEFLASDHVVELLPTERRSIAKYRGQGLFTTAEMLSVQSRILDRFRAGARSGVGVVSATTLAEALETHDQLTIEQKALVASFVTSGHRAQCAIGRAGAGKTTAMRVAAEAWSAAGYKVLGTAVKGEAARHLGNEAGIASETLAWHLAHTDPATSSLDGRTVLIVDEASTVCDRDLDRLLWLCDATGAAVRLIGDPDQHGAVGAGGMFRVLCQDDAETPELRISHRVSDPNDRAAADAMREGRIADALAALQAAGHLHIVTDEIDLYLDLLQRWWTARRSGSEHPMVDRRNHTRWQLNRLAHRLLQVTGDVGAEEMVASRGRRFSVGDRVVARIGDRSLHPTGRPGDYVRNGTTGTVVAMSKHRNSDKDRLRVAFAGLGEVDLPRSFFDEHDGPRGRKDVGLDHAYAVTSYSVQGLTFSESTSRIDENASRSETYVDITRGRLANHLYLTRSVDPLDGEHLPKAPRPPIDVSVGERLSASGPEHAAVDIDPRAPAVVSVRAGRDLAQLHGAAKGGGAPAGVKAAETLRARQVARVATSSLDPAVLAKLPPRSHVPHLAHQWDQTVSDLSVFLARWNLKPGGARPWEWAVGTSCPQADLLAERRLVTDRIVALTVASVSEAARAIDYDLPPWASAHLAHNAAQGHCRHDLGQLKSLYDRIDTYRRQGDIGSPDQPCGPAEALLGATPDDPVLRARRRALIEQALPGPTPSTPPPARTRP